MPVVTIVDPDAAEPKVAEVPEGATLFEAGAKVTAGIDTSCVGKGTCGLCRVKILAGAEHLNPFTDEEKKHLGNVYHLTRVRLSCRSKVSGDVTIQVVRRKK
jgi:ferredoxin